MKTLILCSALTLCLAGTAAAQRGQAAKRSGPPVNLLPGPSGKDLAFMAYVDEGAFGLGYERVLSHRWGLRLGADSGPGSLQAAGVELTGYGASLAPRLYLWGQALNGLFVGGRLRYFTAAPGGDASRSFSVMRMGPQAGLQLAFGGRLGVGLAVTQDRDSVSDDKAGAGYLALPIQNRIFDLRTHVEASLGWIF